MKSKRNAQGTKAKYSSRSACILLPFQTGTAKPMHGQAVSEMAVLAKIVQNEAEVLWSRKCKVCVRGANVGGEAQIVRHVNACLHALKFGPSASQATFLAGSTGFLNAQLPLPQSGSQLTTNVRIMASEEPFSTVASMVADLVCMLSCDLGLPPVCLCCSPLGRRNGDGDGSDHMFSTTDAACSAFGRDTSEGILRTRVLELELKLLQAANDIVGVRLASWIERILKKSK